MGVPPVIFVGVRARTPISPVDEETDGRGARSRATGVARFKRFFLRLSDARSLHFRDKWPCFPFLDVRCRSRGSAAPTGVSAHPYRT